MPNVSYSHRHANVRIAMPVGPKAPVINVDAHRFTIAHAADAAYLQQKVNSVERQGYGMPDEPQVGIEDVVVAQLVECDPDILTVVVEEVVPLEDAKA